VKELKIERSKATLGDDGCVPYLRVKELKIERSKALIFVVVMTL
jgi:hypothetical protein